MNEIISIEIDCKKSGKKNNDPLTLDEIECYHGYHTGTDKQCIHCGKKYVLVDIVQIPKDKSNDGTGFVNIVTCECGHLMNYAECKDVLNVVDKDSLNGRVLLGLGILSKMMEDDYNENKETGNLIESDSDVYGRVDHDQDIRTNKSRKQVH